MSKKTHYYYGKTKKINRKLITRFFGGVIIGIGVLLFLYFLFPVLSYQMFLASSMQTIEVPVPRYMMAKKSGLSELVSQGIASLTRDFTDARNWYPNSSSDIAKIKVEKYFLSIPKLKIEDAEVATNDYDLSKHLVQYFGTSTPSERGTAVIFGHSTLPQWFDAKNYKTIFATLHTLKTGDEIFAKVNGVNYKYKIFSINITSPDDTNMFLQSYDNSYITLVTCTPPGTVWKRLIIRASLDKLI